MITSGEGMSLSPGIQSYSDGNVMKTLNLISDHTATVGNSFRFEIKPNRDADGYLMDFNEGGVLTIMKMPSILRDSWTEEEVAERERLNNMEPVKTGEIVRVNGREYKVKILGNYSDAGRLIPC